MDDVQKLASVTGQEVAEWRTTLHNHTKTLNAVNAKIDRFEERVDEHFTKVDERFTRVDERFDKVETEMRDGFGMLAEGQQRITDLLTQHIEECDKG
jgi:uncharacterized phage infection (PIP) family protein YhgE